MTLKAEIKPTKCKLCELKYTRNSSDLFVHTSEICLTERLSLEQIKNEKLTKSLASWKDAWLNQHDIIGRISWEIPPVHYLSDKLKQEFKDKAKELEDIGDWMVPMTVYLEHPENYRSSYRTIKIYNEWGDIVMTIHPKKV